MDMTDKYAVSRILPVNTRMISRIFLRGMRRLASRLSPEDVAAAPSTCDSCDLKMFASYLSLVPDRPQSSSVMSLNMFRQPRLHSHQGPLEYIARTWQRVILRTRPIMADTNDDLTTRSQASDPFHALPTELLASILGHLTARERCYLRLQSTHIRSFVDKYEEARSISLYVRDSARRPQPWDSILDVDLRTSLTRLACEYEKHDNYHYIALVVAERLHDLPSENKLDIKAPAPESVINAILDLHHVQRLLADEERRGLRLDGRLVAAQKAIHGRLVAVYGLQNSIIWPIDIVVAPSSKKRQKKAKIEEATEPLIQFYRFLIMSQVARHSKRRLAPDTYTHRVQSG